MRRRDEDDGCRLVIAWDPVEDPGVGEHSGRRRAIQLLALIAAGFLYTSLPALVSLIETGRKYGLANTTGSVEFTQFGSRLRTPTLLLFLLVCGWVILTNFGRLVDRRTGRLVLVGGGLIFLLVVDYVLTGTPQTGALTAVTLAFAIWAIGPRLEDLRVFGVTAATLAFSCLILAMVWPSAWQLDEEKGFLGEEVLAGPFSQMNVLGMVLAVLLPFSMTLRSRIMRIACLLAVLGSLVLAASRTSLIAAGVTVVGMGILAVLKAPLARRVALTVGTLILSLVVILLPLDTNDRTLFTDRGGIWINTREFTADSWVIGHGLRTFRLGGPLFQVTHEQAAHAHNLFLQYWAMLGVFGVAVLIIFVIVVLRNSSAALPISVVPAATIVAFLAIGIAEVPLRPEVFDGPSWITWPAFLTLVFLETDQRTTAPEEDQEKDSQAAAPSPRWGASSMRGTRT